MAKRKGGLVEGEVFTGEVTADYKEGKWGPQVEVRVQNPATDAQVIGWFGIKLDDDGDCMEIRKSSTAFAVLDSVREATGKNYFSQDEGPVEYIREAFDGKIAQGIRLDNLGKMTNVMQFRRDDGGESSGVGVAQFQSDDAALEFAADLVNGLTVQEAKSVIRKDSALKAAGYKGASLVESLVEAGLISTDGDTITLS